MLSKDRITEIFGEEIFLVKTYTEKENIYELNDKLKTIKKTDVLYKEYIDIMCKNDVDHIDDEWDITRKGHFHMMYLPYFYTVRKITSLGAEFY